MALSPWFAAGAGIVMAMGALIYAPHASLGFGRAIQVTHCQQSLCRQVIPQGGGALIPAGSGVTASPSPSAADRVMTVSYEPLHDSTPSSFALWIMFSPPPSLSHWQLRFVIPGATYIYVYGALSYGAVSVPSGTDGVTVTSLIAASDSAGYAPISGDQNGVDSLQSANGTVLFQVRGTGPNSSPARCSFSGGGCVFTLSSDRVPAGLPSRG